MKNRSYNAKIPANTTVLYLRSKQILTVIGPLKTKSLFLKPTIFLVFDKNIIRIDSNKNKKLSTNQEKKLAALQGTTLALIKQALVETSYLLYAKLKFIGIGYRSFDVDEFPGKLILFKLGYSHSIFFKVNKSIKIFSLKRTKLFIWGDSYQSITKTAALIRSYKKPEPYKGKGILYENEKIQLKEGKKV